jgi:tetratricopeptide (TPR) repeat protein
MGRFSFKARPLRGVALVLGLLLAPTPSFAQTRDENVTLCQGGGDPQAAISACTLLIQSGQEDASNVVAEYERRSDAYKRAGLLDQALADTNKALALDPNDADAYVDRGNVYKSKHQYDRALRDYDQAIRLDPKSAPAFYDRGSYFLDRRKYDRAIQDDDQAIRLKPDYASAFDNRCYARAVLGRLPQALADCNEAVRMAATANHYDSRGLVYLKMKNYAAAIADYDSALQIDPKLDASLYGRGLAKRQTGDRAGGDADIRSAKAVTPDIAATFGK